jgi:glucokinase
MNIGIDLGGSHIAVGTVKKGKIEKKREIEVTEADKQNAREFVEENILKLISEIQEEKIETIGIAAPGTVSENKIIRCINLGIENYNIVEKIKEKLEERYKIKNVKIKLSNDAKCAAIAEQRYGCLRGYKDSIFLTLGTGIGGAVILNNELITSKQVPGYEFGHMTINLKSKEKCKCGKVGCFEQYASMKTLKNNLKKALEIDGYVSGEQLYEILKYDKILNKKYKKINQVINEFTEYLAIGISNLVNIFEPQIIGIGGSYVYFEEFIEEKLKDLLLNRNLLFNEREDIIIRPAELGNEAGIVGASIIVQEE